MEESYPPARTYYLSYFFEKDAIVEASIRKEFWYFLDIVLLEINLTPKFRIFTIINIALYFLANAAYIPLLTYTTYLLRNDLNHFINSLHYTLLVLLSLFLFLRVSWCQDFFFESHYRHAHHFYDYREGTSPDVEELKKESIKDKRALLIMPVFVLIIGGLLFAANFIDEYLDVNHTIYLNGVNIKLFVPIYMPFETHKGLGYFVATGTLLMEVFFTARILAGCIFMYTIVMQRMMLQIRILRSSVSRIEQRSKLTSQKLFGKTKSDQESDQKVGQESDQKDFCLIQCLKKNIIHYQIVRRYCTIISRVIKHIMLLTFAVGSIIIALSMISISKGGSTIGNRITVFAMCSAEVAIMFIICYYCEQLVEECALLFDELYWIEWYKYSKEFNRLMFAFKETIKEPLVIKAGDMVEARLDTFKTIINTSYSYFNCLKAFEQKK